MKHCKQLVESDVRVRAGNAVRFETSYIVHWDTYFEIIERSDRMSIGRIIWEELMARRIQ